METAPARHWYTKKRYIIPLGVLGVVAFASVASDTSTYTPPTIIQPAAVQQAVVNTNTPAPTYTPPAPTQKTVPLSNDNYYTNVDGNKVHSPAYAPSKPAGASAKCRDGTYSFSQNRRGTCSHHGGVAQWY